MNNKFVIILTIILIVIIIVMLFMFENINQENNNKIAQNAISMYNQDENMDYNSLYKEESNIIYDTTIQGIVELKKDDTAYIFGGQHFGEYGYKMEEYTTAYIQLKNQKCIDYISLKEYNTDYIEEGDILICPGNLTVGEYDYNQMDIKENIIIVLKQKDYYKMQEEVLNDSNATITIGDMYLLDNEGNTNVEGSHIYIKYKLENYRNAEEKYSFPFSKKVYITNNTEIIGNLTEGAKIKIQYNSNEPYNSGDAYEGIELKKIEVVE